MDERARQIWQIAYATKFALLFSAYRDNKVYELAEKCADAAVEQYELSRAAAKQNRHKHK